MSALQTPTENPSAARTAARLLAEFAGFAVLLFLTRFVARGHLIPLSDQECHIGGIAVDVLAHGVRFPLLVYAPNEYDNGSFFSGLLAALSFSVLGRNVLALKLVTHLISAAGAVATLWLLRACLRELGLTDRHARWAAVTVLVIALAFAPRVVTLCSMYAVGNHAEGSAIDTLLLALFAYRLHTRSLLRIAAFWALVGFALYLNKGTSLVIPVLGVAEVMLARGSVGRLAAACGGFVVGILPELRVVALQYGAGSGALGWVTMAGKAERNVQAFPRAFFDDLLSLGDHRIGLLAAWALALGVGVALLVRPWRQRIVPLPRPDSHGSAHSGYTPPLMLSLVVGVTVLHVAALTVMAHGGIDAYEIYSYPTLAVLVSVLVAVICTSAVARWGRGAGTWVAAAAVAVSVVLYRPNAMHWEIGTVAKLWGNRAGSACSWRFAEGFEREYDYGLAPPGQTREQHAITRCRSLTEPVQILDCIGGIAREIGWREFSTVHGEPPAELTAAERRAYAYWYGTHRKGNGAPCREFDRPDLAADCAAAVQLECLVFGDIYTGIVSGQRLSQPRCTIPEPPMNGFWAAMRRDLLTRTAGTSPHITPAPVSDADLKACTSVFDACY
jgi:hypothetical protein